MNSSRLSTPFVVAAVCVLLGACGGPQSTLDPAGPAAESIARIWWVMLIGAVLILALVLGLLGYALRRDGQRRSFGSPDRFILAGGLALPAVVLAALLVYGLAQSRRITAADEAVQHVIEVVGHQWFWEFRYPDSGIDPVPITFNRVLLPRGELVEFHVTSNDVIHSFWIPRLGGKIDAIPGVRNTLRLQADRGGPMRGQCAEFCGLNHAHMTFEVNVVEAADYRVQLEAAAESFTVLGRE